MPWVAVPAGEYGRTEVFYRFRYRDFKQEAYSPYTGITRCRASTSTSTSDRPPGTWWPGICSMT